MRRLRAYLTASIILAVLLVAPRTETASAQGFPSFAATAEVVIVGDQASPDKARSHGVWAWETTGVSLQQPSKVGDSFWFPSTPHARLTDGVVRARLDFGRNVDATLLFRANLPADLERLSAYGLSVEGNTLRFYRWDDGLVSPQGAAISIPELRRRVGIEIVLFAVGPLFTATVYDARNLEQIATLALTDRRYPGGVVGLRAFHTQDPGTRLTHLSVAQAGQSRNDDPSELAGSKRVAKLTAEGARRLPVELRELMIDEDGGPVMLLHLDELARLRRAGVEPVSVSAEVPWKYVDPEYRARRGLPPEPTEDGFRLDAGYKNAAMVNDLLAGYERRFPEIARLVRIGESVDGRPLLALKISDHPAESESEPAVLLDGAHHALELLTTEFVLDAIQTLVSGYGRDPEMTRFVDNFEIWCVPLVNPDGNYAFMEMSTKAGRKNNRDNNGDGRFAPREGVDLNRNYPFRWGQLGEEGSRTWTDHHRYRGPGPGSEPETAAMMALARRERPVAAISYHTNATAILSPYATDGVKNPLNDEAWPIAEEIAAATPRQPNGKRYRVRRKLYAVDGVSKDWLRAEIGTVAFLVEGPLHNPRDAERRRLAIEATRPTWITLLGRFLDGPSITGRVTDQDGAPLTAEVRVLEIVPQEGERWTSRPRDGRYARYLPAPGTYHLRVEAPGYEPARRRLDVSAHVAEVDFSLRPAAPGPDAAQ